MKRLLSSIFALAFAATLGTSAMAASTPAPAMSKTTTTASTSCPKGESYVKGYTKSNGTKVAGYCRKSSSSSSSSMKSSVVDEVFVVDVVLDR